MSNDRLKHLKETLMCAVEAQMCNLQEADTDELMSAVDMIKDLEEAMYYCTITEAMHGNGEKKHREEKEYEFEFNNNKGNQERMYYRGPMVYNERRPEPMMYNDGNQGSTMYNDGNRGSMMYNDGNRGSSSDTGGHDEKDGRSYMSRRMYMDAKMYQADKTVQLRELEKYMQELSQDIVDMIQDASQEEKQYLEKKMTTLATKIGQMK